MFFLKQLQFLVNILCSEATSTLEALQNMSSGIQPKGKKIQEKAEDEMIDVGQAFEKCMKAR